MKRDFLRDLLEWKTSPSRKPLIVEGARQVGKTYTIQEFGNAHYDQVITLNFEQDPALGKLFEGSLEPARILSVLQAFSGRSIVPGSSLLFFDEVQQCDRALTSLKYFCEQAPEYHLIAAGSLLGIHLRTTTPFPVGKVNFLTLYPMTFLEFLDARGQGNLRAFIASQDPHLPYPEPLRDKLEENLRFYYYVGGMPESVATFCRSGDLGLTRKVQREILRSYLLDFSKYATPSETLKISQLWESVPVHLSKENKKFIFSAVKKSARAREYESALQWLLDAGLLVRVTNVEHPAVPLHASTSENNFKIYFHDIGLLCAMTQIDSRVIVMGDSFTGDSLFTTFKGALTENYVAQTLKSLGWNALYYWTSGHQAEVDFLLEYNSNVIPLEVKSGFNSRAKSLKIFQKTYAPALAIRTSLQSQQLNDGMFDCPLFALGQLNRVLKAQGV